MMPKLPGDGDGPDVRSAHAGEPVVPPAVRSDAGGTARGGVGDSRSAAGKAGDPLGRGGGTVEPGSGGGKVKPGGSQGGGEAKPGPNGGEAEPGLSGSETEPTRGAGARGAATLARGTGTILAEPAWRPDPRARLLWGTELVLSWLLPVIGFGVWVVLDDGRRGLQAGVGTLLAILVVATVAVIPMWRYAVHRWEITEEAVYTRVGWLTQESRVAPISRVQTVDIERGPLDRVFGLATVTVTTASSAGAVPITGLDLPVAEDAVARLTRIAALHRGDAT